MILGSQQVCEISYRSSIHLTHAAVRKHATVTHGYDTDLVFPGHFELVEQPEWPQSEFNMHGSLINSF